MNVLLACLVAVVVGGLLIALQRSTKVTVVEDVAPAPTKKGVSTKTKKRQAAAKAKQLAAAAEKKANAEAKAARKKAAKEAAKAQAALEAKKQAAAPAPETDKKKKKKKKKKTNKNGGGGERTESTLSVTETVQAADAAVEDEDWEVVKAAPRKVREEEIETEASGDEYSNQAEITIASEFFGKIIGGRGATIDALKYATNTDISIPDKGKFGPIVIRGKSAEDCTAAKQAIQELVDTGYSTITHPDRASDGIDVPNNMRAIVIGSGGENLKAITALCPGISLDFPDADSGTTWVSIAGPEALIPQVKEAIQDIMDNLFASMVNPTWTCQHLGMPSQYMGSLIGSGGSVINQLQRSTRTVIKTSPTDPNTGMVGVRVAGEPSDVATVMRMLQELIRTPDEIPVPPEWSRVNTVPQCPWDLEV